MDVHLGLKAGGPEARCTEWEPDSTIPETGFVQSVSVFSANNRMYVTYTKPNVDRIHVLVSEGQLSNGRLSLWKPQGIIPGSRADQAPTLNLHYAQDGTQGSIARVVLAIWSDRVTRELMNARVELDRTPNDFTSAVTVHDIAGRAIRGNGTAPSLAFWGEDSSSSTNKQSWLALADHESRIRIYTHDREANLWRDMTSVIFGTRPTGLIHTRMGFAYHPILLANGRPLHPLKGEFTLVYGADNEGEVASIWISDIVDINHPPHLHLRFPTVLAGRFGHAWYGVLKGEEGGFVLYSDPAFPYLKGAAVKSNGAIGFLPYVDGVFDLNFSAGSDFQIMERGICMHLTGMDTRFCGQINSFGF